MPENHPGWGGRRNPQPGRPKLEHKMLKTAATLYPEQIERLRQIGDGSVSKGIRVVLEHYEKSAA